MSQAGKKIGEWCLYGNVSEDSFYYRGLVNRKRVDEKREDWVPVVLVILNIKRRAGRRIILQHRTIYNTDSDLGTFSNISRRVNDLDVYRALDVLGEELPEYVEMPDQDGTRASNDFAGFSGLSRGDLVPENAWREAAIRELSEELGLVGVRGDCLIPQGAQNVVREPGPGGYFFRIFSLELTTSELKRIRDNRPRAELYEHSLDDIHRRRAEEQFNRFLRIHFDDVFVPIFQKLGVV